jgi:hypothetical protein
MAIRRHRARRGLWNNGQTYHYSGELRLHRLGNLITGSREIVRARITGTEPDPSRIGSPGDGLLTADAVTDYINQLLGAQPEDIVT